MKIFSIIMYIMYAVSFIVTAFAAIKGHKLEYIVSCMWIVNAALMFERADKFKKIYFDGIEKDIEQKVDKFMKEIKNESI